MLRFDRSLAPSYTQPNTRRTAPVFNSYKKQILRDMGIDIWRRRPDGWVGEGAEHRAGGGAPTDPVRDERPAHGGASGAAPAAEPTTRSETASTTTTTTATTTESLAPRSSVHADSAFSALRDALPRTAVRQPPRPLVSEDPASIPQTSSQARPPIDSEPGEDFVLSFTCFFAANLLIVADTRESNDDDHRFLRDVVRAARGDWSKPVEQVEFVWPQSRIDISRAGAVKALAAMFEKYRGRGVVKVVSSADEVSTSAINDVGFETETFTAVAQLRRSVTDKRRLWQLIRASRR